MKFEELVDTVGELPVFRSSLLLAGERDRRDVRRQLSRWKAAGKVLQLRRNVYVLGAPWRRVDPHPFLVANELERPSYVSLESALAHHGLIPELVPVTTSVTTGRPGIIDTPLGRYLYRHVHPRGFFGYEPVPVLPGRDAAALIADPAKALLDLVYFTPGGDSPEYLESLRLEGLDAVTPRLRAHARRWGRSKLQRAVTRVLEGESTDEGGATRRS